MRSVRLVLAAALLGSLGCWEQIDGGKWFPQMKRQIAALGQMPKLDKVIDSL